MALPQPAACHLLCVGSNARGRLWYDAAAEGWVAPEHRIHRSAGQVPHGIVAPLFPVLVQVAMAVHGQPRSSAIQMLKLAKHMTFQEKFLCRNIFPDSDKGMDCLDILQKWLNQDGKTFVNTSFCTVTKFEAVALYFQIYLQTRKGPHSGDAEKLWFSQISIKVAKIKKKIKAKSWLAAVMQCL